MKRPSRRRWLARAIAGPRADERGFSIMEFIIAMTLLLLIIVATSQTLTGAVRVSANVRQRVVATNLATQTLEGLRATANNAALYASIPITTTTLAPTVLDGTTFTVTQDVEWEAVGSAGTACDAGLKTGFVLRATAIVSWPGSVTTVQSSTLLAPPLGAYNQLNGAVGIRVFNAAGKGNGNVVVTAMTGGVTPVVPSITTGTDGCAFFDSLPVGSYTFTVVQASPYGVDSQEQHLSTTAPITAAIGSTVQYPPISYDDAATILYTFLPAAPAVATGMSVSVANVALASRYYNYPVPPTAPLYTINSAFPFPSGYTMFAGDCSDSDPLGKDITNTAFYPAPSPSPTVLTVTPGGTTVSTVALYPLNINVVSSTNSPVSNPTLATVSNTPATTNPVACPFGFPAYTLTPGNGGGISNTGVGLGHLTITATGKVGGVNKSSNPVYVWVWPDGLYMASSVSGAKGTLVYSFAAPSSLKITLLP